MTTKPNKTKIKPVKNLAKDPITATTDIRQIALQNRARLTRGLLEELLENKDWGSLMTHMKGRLVFMKDEEFLDLAVVTHIQDKYQFSRVKEDLAGYYPNLYNCNSELEALGIQHDVVIYGCLSLDEARIMTAAIRLNTDVCADKIVIPMTFSQLIKHRSVLGKNPLSHRIIDDEISQDIVSTEEEQASPVDEEERKRQIAIENELAIRLEKELEERLAAELEEEQRKEKRKKQLQQELADKKNGIGLDRSKDTRSQLVEVEKQIKQELDKIKETEEQNSNRLDTFIDTTLELEEGEDITQEDITTNERKNAIKEQLIRDLDRSDKQKEKNNKVLARIFAVHYNVTVVSTPEKNIIYRYVDNLQSKMYGLWMRVDNEDSLASMLDTMVDELDLSFVVSSTRMSMIIHEVKVFDKDKFFIKDTEDSLLLQTNHAKYIRFKDTTISVDGQNQRYRPDLFLTSKLPFEMPKVNKKTPTIDYYFNSTFSDRSEEDRAKLRVYIQYKIGQAMFNDTSTQDSVLLIGKGGSGKSLLTKVITYMFTGGIYNENVTSVTVGQLNSQRSSFFLSMLWNSYINIVGEVSEEERLDSEMMKQLIGGDLVTAEYKNRPMFSFYCRSMFWILSNHMPYIRDNNEASKRRFQIIRFNKSFTGRPDYTLEAKMKEESIHWIRECIGTYLAYKNKKIYPVPSECSRELNRVLDENDKLLSYMNDSLMITGNRLDRIERSKLYKDFQNWCREMGYKAYSREAMVDRVRRSEYANKDLITIAESNVNDINRVYITGVRFNTDSVRV